MCGECPHEGVQDGPEVLRIDEPGSVSGLADLLMVGPVLGEVPGGVQPDRVWFGTCPAHRSAESVQVESLPVLDDLISDGGEQFDEDRRADTAGCGHPLAVDPVEEGGESPRRRAV